MFADKGLYIIAEVSANHGGEYGNAARLIREAKHAGADCVKFQLYSPDTMVCDSDHPLLQINDGPWKGQSLHDLYAKAMTPWEWMDPLREACQKEGIDFLCTAYEKKSFDYLMDLNIDDMVKVSSFELTHIPLLRQIANSKVPAIISTGMSTQEEVLSAIVPFLRNAVPFALLVCVSQYPAYDIPLNDLVWYKKLTPYIGLSDHTMTSTSAIAAVAMGATIIEKHIKLTDVETVDSFYSMSPDQFVELVNECRSTYRMIGSLPRNESTKYRRSIWVTKHIRKGETITENNTAILRPEGGIPPASWDVVYGRKVAMDILAGTPLHWNQVEGYNG